MTSYLIIGAGNFSAATALALAKRPGILTVTLVEPTNHPNPRAASHDKNKIVRDGYPDRLRRSMLRKAMPMWRKDPLYNRFYHEVGMLWLDRSNFADSIIASSDKENSQRPERLTVEKARRRWSGAFAEANLGELSHVLYNPGAATLRPTRRLLP